MFSGSSFSHVTRCYVSLSSYDDKLNIFGILIVNFTKKGNFNTLCWALGNRDGHASFTVTVL